MNRQLVKSSLGALLVTLVLSVKALAMPISGVLNFAGGATLDNADLSLATQVLSWQPVSVTSVTGTLDTTINPGDAVTMAPGAWSFTSGKANLWTVGGFTFSLATSGVTQTVDFINVLGTGTISGNGYDPTPGFWYFSTQGATGIPQISFSATTRAIPDGGTTALLLGLGLTGIALIARRQRKLV
jgi:hypothetical protein